MVRSEYILVPKGVLFSGVEYELFILVRTPMQQPEVRTCMYFPGSMEEYHTKAAEVQYSFIRAPYMYGLLDTMVRDIYTWTPKYRTVPYKYIPLGADFSTWKEKVFLRCARA